MKTNNWYRSTSFFQSIVPAKFGHSIVVSEGGILLIDRNWSTYINYWSVGEQGIFKVDVHLHSMLYVLRLLETDSKKSGQIQKLTCGKKSTILELSS